MKRPRYLTLDVFSRLLKLYEDFSESSRLSELKSKKISPLGEFLKSSGSAVELKEREVLFLQDDPGDGMYWIESGVLVVLQDNLDDPRFLAFRQPGQVVGEIALLEDVQRTASVAAFSAARLRYLGKDKFQELLSLIPGFGVELMRLLSSRLREVKPAEYADGLYDHLTGALSRQAFDTRLQEEIERSRIYQNSFLLVFLDLDRFKDVNDSYGHTRGDEVLISFVERVKSNLRTTDLLFRYGGDEFMLILQGVDDSLGQVIVKKLLKEISSSPLQGDPPVEISVSAGIAYFPFDGDTPQVLLEAADRRVYRAKKDGGGFIAYSQDKK